MRLKRSSQDRDKVYEARMAEATEALVESTVSLAKADQAATTTARIAENLRRELHDNHFAPALAEAIARSIR